ncbi:MAG: CBS domain-containing protein, partial [Alphaproteobacteria bacterium]|nr:CBS domain-containing protein [Alphaproteobacteria bacterium]
STGREGPVVHIGATIGAQVAEWLRMPPNMSRTLLGCGVAAAVACSFNAPIAGVFFALEVVVGHYALNAFAPIVVASVTATVVSRSYYGDFPAFILPRSYEIASIWEFPAFALLGMVSAVVAMIFMWSVIRSEDIVARLRLPLVIRPAIGGLAVGAIAIWFPEVLGVGYETTDRALSEEMSLTLLLALIAIKTAATAISLGFSFGGGVFSPSLFVGAMTGGAFGILATAAFPDLSSGYGAYTLIGMGAVAGSVLGAPMSTILILFEMTGDYAVTLALMVAVVFSSVLTQAALGKSLFTWQLARRGISLESGREKSLLRQIRVADVMKHDYARIAPDAGWAEILAKLRDAPYGELYVVDERERLKGVITVVELAQTTSRPGESETPPTAIALARPNPPALAADDELGKAIAMIDRINESHIPVVDSLAAYRIVGYIHEHDVMLAYRRALTRAQAEDRR